MRASLLCLLACALLHGAPVTIAKDKIHLRSGAVREWSSFPPSSPGKSISLPFTAETNPAEYSLLLRQRDVKITTWSVLLNGRKLGVLQDDERRMVRILPIPASTLVTGANTLQITAGSGPVSDDIELSGIHIEPVPVASLLRQSTLTVDVQGDSAPVKLTIVDAQGFLTPLSSLRSDAREALRTGVLYTAEAQAQIGLPAGDYRVYASRGFEYSAPSAPVRLAPGATQHARLRIRREVTIPGFVSADTHVHTRELSGHGDATVAERVLTAAGEGLDLIIVTEHNQAADYAPALTKQNLGRWVAAIPGNEVTTTQGHFNIFPVRPGTPQPDPREPAWPALMDSLHQGSVQIVIQNHPRDLHSGYRPFAPAHHLSGIGQNLEQRPFRANAMEVVNSGAMSSDPLQLVRDWMGLLTRGLPVAAIGSSDTHTVDFVPIGQARTYIQGSKNKPEELFRALAAGRNLVSYGLAAQLRPAGKPRRTPEGTRVEVELTVYGPSWSTADRVAIFSNGQPIWEDALTPSHAPGLKLRRKVTLTLPAHDATLVAVATGPGVLEPFWEVRKPYQSTTPDWSPLNLGVSQAVPVDADGDGTVTSPLALAQKLVEQHGKQIPALVEALSAYDPSVTMHVLDLLRSIGAPITRASFRGSFQNASRPVRQGADQYYRELLQVRLDR